MPRVWIEAFLREEVIPKLTSGSMDPEALASVAAAVPALIDADVSHGREAAGALMQAVSGHIESSSMTVTALGQVAVSLFKAKVRPSQAWLDVAAAFVKGSSSMDATRRECEQCLDWLQALARP